MGGLTLEKQAKYLTLAKTMADLFSKDKSRKVGALFLAPDSLEILTSGYNGFPRGIDETIQERWQRPQKYSYVEHAERNCVYNASRRGIPLENSICVVTMFPCSACARALIQVGVKGLLSFTPDFEDPRWGKEFKISMEMFKEAGIEVCLLNDPTI